MPGNCRALSFRLMLGALGVVVCAGNPSPRGQAATPTRAVGHNAVVLPFHVYHPGTGVTLVVVLPMGTQLWTIYPQGNARLWAVGEVDPPTPTPTPPAPGDVHVDGRIDSLDLFQWSFYWQQSETESAFAADVVDDGKIDEKDLLRLIDLLKR